MQTTHDMVLSMGVVIGVVAALLAVTWRPHRQVTYPVDYLGTVQQAVAQAPWVVEVPQAAGYTPTVARFESEDSGPPGALRLYLGFTDAQGGYVSEWQSNGRTAAVVKAATNGGDCQEGPGWTRCQADRPLTRSLVRVVDGVTTVVSGTVEWAALTTFASSLQPAAPVQ